MLRHKADLRSLAFLATYFGLVTGGWLLDPSSWLVRVPLVAATCVFSFFCAVITHNSIHAPVFRGRTMSSLFKVVLSLAYGHPVSSYVPGHNLSHHDWMQSRRDVMRTTKLRFRWHLLNQLTFLYVVGGAITRAELTYLRVSFRKRPRWARQFMFETVVFLGAYAALLAIDWRRFILFVIIPHAYAAWGIVGMNLVQHDGCDPEHPYNHSRNFVGKWINWWTFNNGLHGIHHMYPSLHWSKLPARHAEVLGPHLHPALAQESLFPYLWRTYIWPGKRLDYLGRPVVLAEEGPDEPWIQGEPGVPEPPPKIRIPRAATLATTAAIATGSDQASAA